jgi:bacterioferritin
MKGNEALIETLNQQIADELTAINQYILHSEMCANWGYERLHDVIEKRAIEEMKHAEMLIARVLFLEGKPIVSKLNDLHVGAEVLDQLQNDVEAEYGAVKTYNAAISQAVSLGDNGTRELLEEILEDEEEHIDWLEAQLDQVRQIGIQNYLTMQLKD